MSRLIAIFLASVGLNTDAELFAFGKRLGEEFNLETLKQIFDWPVGAEDSAVPTHLVSTGYDILSEYVKAYLRYHFPRLPEEGIIAIYDFLISEDMLAHVGKHLGFKELVEVNIFPASDEDIAESFKAVLGGLAMDSGSAEKSEFLIQDFLLAQLIGVDINELFLINNPMGVLNEILKSMNRGDPEPRLLRSAGSGTITPVHVVGIYCDKQLLGQSPGETIPVAEEMAARDSLRNLWGTTEDRTPFAFGEAGRNLNLAEFRTKTNGSLFLMCESEKKSEEKKEPLDYSEMMMKFKEDIEPRFGVPYRRRLKHKWYGGTYNRKTIKRWIIPKPTNI